MTSGSETYCTALCSAVVWTGANEADNMTGCNTADGSAKTAIHCATGFIPTTGNTKCVAAIAGCTIANPTTTTQCDTCGAGYIADTAGTGCVIC